MNKIHLLPQSLSNQIAAGEVIVRPAFALKELLENAIDAGARKIQISLVAGGMKKIQVTDDGMGIAREDLAMALVRHATSKITTEQDLYRVETMGFRGEALASMSAVGAMRMISRERDAAAAWMVETQPHHFVDGIVIEAVPASHPEGTTVVLEDLFFNVPARRSFLASERTEYKHCEQQFLNCALHYFDIHWSFSHNGKTIFDFAVCKDEREIAGRLLHLMGEDFCHNSVRLEQESLGMRLSGWLGMPIVASDKPAQYFYVNHRVVKDKRFIAALKTCFRDVLHQQKQPPFVLNMEISPDLVDVNIHPQKSEVRFRAQQQVYGFFISTLTHAINGFSPGLTVQRSMGQSAGQGKIIDEKVGGQKKADFQPQGSDGSQDEMLNLKLKSFEPNEQKQMAFSSSSGGMNSVHSNSRTPHFGREKRSSELLAEQLARSLDENRWEGVKQAENNESRFFETSFSTTFSATAATTNSSSKTNDSSKNNKSNNESSKNEMLSGVVEAIPPLGYAVAQIQEVYIVSINANGLILVDMHAAHERVIYESLKRQVSGKSTQPSQRLLLPVLLALSVRETANYEEVAPLLKQLGFGLSLVGNQLTVESVPVILMKQRDLGSIVRDALSDDELETGQWDAGITMEEKIFEKLSRSACQQAVRAGEKLSLESMNQLLRQIEQTPRSNQCNHGRPTWVSLPLSDLDALFLRGQ